MSDSGVVSGRRRGWNRQLAWFVLPFAALTLLSVSMAAWDVHAHRATGFFGAMFPYLIDGQDLAGFAGRFRLYGSAGFFQPYSQQFPDVQSFNYAAPLAVVTHLLFKLPFDPVGCVHALLAAWLLILGSAFLYACMRSGARFLPCALLTVGVLALSRPVVLLSFTANLELFVWMATGTGVFLWAVGRSRPAAACFGLAGAMKYLPLLTLGLFLPRGRWRSFAVGLAVFACMMLAGLWLLGPSVPVAFRGLQGEIARFTGHYLLQWQRTDNGYDHSAFGCVKLVLVASGHEASLVPALRLYTVAVAVTVPVLYFMRIRHLRELDQLIVFAIFAVWLAPMSQDYTLVHLLAPFGCLLLDRFHQGWQKSDAVRLLCFGMVFSALDFVHLGPARLGGNVKAVVLGLLLAQTLRQDVSRKSIFHQVPEIPHPTAEMR